MASNIADIDVAGGSRARCADDRPPAAGLQPAAPPRYYLLWLMLPAILLLAAISLYPFVWLIYMSLHEVQLAPGKSDVWAGIDNFSRLARDKNFARGLAHALQVQRALPHGRDRTRRLGSRYPSQQPL